MRIAILSNHYGKGFRGAEIWAKTLKERLKNYEVRVFTGVFDWGWAKSDLIIPIDGRLQALVTRIISFLFQKPMIIFGHSGLGADDKWNLLCSPNVFVAFSMHQKEWAEKFKLPWTRVVLIPHAIDIKEFAPARKKPGKKIVLCVAANTPEKRVGLVKKAVGLIPGVKFMAVGKGNKIEVKYSEMHKVYKKADLFCFVPYPWESFGLVFLEAMATNLPIVTTNDPIRREIVGTAGIFVDNPENPKELGLAIGMAFEKDWGGSPRKQAEKFSWEKIIPKYNKLFESLAKQ